MPGRAGAALLSLLAAAIWAATATSAWAAPPAGDSATIAPDSAMYEVIDGLVFDLGLATLDAHSNADGTGATGTWRVHFGGGSSPTYSGQVTCLAVSGNRATVGLNGTVNRFGEDVPFFGLFLLVDGGPAVPGPTEPLPPVEEFSPPDTVEFRELAAPVGATGCAAAASLPPVFVRRELSNDVTVVDTTPKEQCRHGGWRALGFRNQGQCVASAVRGPQP